MNKELATAMQVSRSFSENQQRIKTAINALSAVTTHTGTFIMNDTEASELRRAMNILSEMSDKSSEWNAAKYVENLSK